MNASGPGRHERPTTGQEARRRLRLGVAVVLALASLQALVLVGTPPAEATHGGVQEWLRQLGIDVGEGLGNSEVAVDGAGNVYVTGNT